MDAAASKVAVQSEAALRRSEQRTALIWALAAGTMVLLLLAPALWNRFPLIFPDTGGYLERPLEGTLEMGRSAFYGLFLAAGMRLAFWPNVIAQAALIVWLIVLTLRAHGFSGRPRLMLGIVALLTFTSSLPWIAGELMPDILFPAAVLAFYLLVFHGAGLSAWERLVLGAVIAFAIMSHMAAAAMLVCMVAAMALLARFAREAWPRARIAFAAGAVAAGIVLCPISNWALTGQFAFTPGGMDFFFGRILDSGIVARYLDDHCPDRALQLCTYKKDLPEDADSWLWDADSPFRLMEPQARTAEERAIILATLKEYPWMHLSTAVWEVAWQLWSFQTEVSIDDNAPTVDVFSSYIPRLMRNFMRARQQRGLIDAAKLNWVHVPVAALALLVVIGALLLQRRLQMPPSLFAFCATILLSIVFNAVVCGVFSHAVDRYGSRLVPLALLAAAILAVEWKRRLTRDA